MDYERVGITIEKIEEMLREKWIVKVYHSESSKNEIPLILLTPEQIFLLKKEMFEILELNNKEKTISIK